MTVLDAYPETWCGYCKRTTRHDGWEYDLRAAALTIYCAVCGSNKESIAADDMPPDLQNEVMVIGAEIGG